jgi:hypothetical protein
LPLNVQLEILVSAMNNDYLNDTSALLYLDNLVFNNVHTYNETNSGILAFYNSNNELSGTTDILDIVNVNKVPGLNRIIIDEASVNNIVLDFIDEYNALQALSAINWVLSNPGSRALPQPPATIAPVITFTPAVITNTIAIDLATYANYTFTKEDFMIGLEYGFSIFKNKHFKKFYYIVD